MVSTERRAGPLIGTLAACAVGVAGWAMPALALGQTTPAPSATRGALLYSTHCIACHSSQMHWRDKKLATDWPSLKAQVQRWQGVASLGWHDADIVEVTRHLNALYYHFPEPQASIGLPERVAVSAAGLTD